MKALLAFLVLGYVAYAITMILLHPRFIYPFQPDDRVLAGFERVQLIGSDGVPISAQERRGTGPVILYFMGNAGAVPLFEAAFDGHIAADRHVIALEYRGGATRPGVPSEATLKSDALVAADYALSLGKPLVVQGFSLGTGLATHVAAERTVERVILTAPYDRLCRLMSERAWLPACWLPGVQKWKSLDDARKIAAPILVLHGAKDRLISPIRSDAFRSLPTVTRIVIDTAAHNDIAQFPAYDEALDAFLEPLR